MKHLKLILSILFIFCLTRTYADDSNYLFRHYQVENGLSDNMATCCVQDRKGYIWIGEEINEQLEQKLNDTRRSEPLRRIYVQSIP